MNTLKRKRVQSPRAVRLMKIGSVFSLEINSARDHDECNIDIALDNSTCYLQRIGR